MGNCSCWYFTDGSCVAGLAVEGLAHRPNKSQRQIEGQAHTPYPAMITPVTSRVGLLNLSESFGDLPHSHLANQGIDVFVIVLKWKEHTAQHSADQERRRRRQPWEAVLRPIHPVDDVAHTVGGLNAQLFVGPVHRPVEVLHLHVSEVL